ncbi:secreted peptidase [Leifsonia rubra CMS 76R]|nr:secreted peptidase [Leifsonia rubra CMS 76R]
MTRAAKAGRLQPLGGAPTALHWPGRTARLLALLRAPLFATTLVVAISVTVWRLFPVSGVIEQTLRDMGSLLVLLLAILLVVLARFGIARAVSTIEIMTPVFGRWRALSSPATKVPSHGTHEYGQTWALDIVAVPPGSVATPFGGLRGSLPPEAFPSFGQPVFAGGNGTVALSRDGAPDRRSRNSWLLLPLFVVESALRGIGGERFVFGNLLVINLDHGGYQALAHLQNGSIGPSMGDRVVTGEQVARCGNSGNSTEPHLHLQLMNRPTPTAAVGFPFVLQGIQNEGTRDHGTDDSNETNAVPARGAYFNAAPSEGAR